MLDMMKITELRTGRSINFREGRNNGSLWPGPSRSGRVLLLDEPLTALDAKFRDLLRVEIDSLLRSLGITAIYVTHDQAEAMALGDRIVVMETARVAQIGSPGKSTSNPEPLCGRFIGTINRINGRVQEHRLVFPEGASPCRRRLRFVPEKTEIRIVFQARACRLVEFGQGHLHATVVASFFMGDRTRLIIEGPSDDYLTIETNGIQSFKRGQRVEVAIDPGALLTGPVNPC